ncbi:7704_t:CDS:1, partial [Acaulospora colombiana]
EEERLSRLRRELDDQRLAAVVSVREEMEAEKLKQEAEEKARRAEEAIREEIVKLKEQDDV